MFTARTRVIGPEVRKRTLYNIKGRRGGGKRKKKKRSESDRKDEKIKNRLRRRPASVAIYIIILLLLLSSRVARMLFFASGSAAAGHDTHGGARETFICDSVDEQTHGPARVETEPARWFFFRRLGDPSVGVRAPRYGRRRRTRGRPRGQWAVGWAWPTARPDTIPPRPLPQLASL